MFKAKFLVADDAFRQLLKDLRAEKKLTQRQLARRLRIPQSYVSKYETGERRLHFVETAYVCRALEMSIEGAPIRKTGQSSSAVGGRLKSEAGQRSHACGQADWPNRCPQFRGPGARGVYCVREAADAR